MTSVSTISYAEMRQNKILSKEMHSPQALDPDCVVAGVGLTLDLDCHKNVGKMSFSVLHRL